VRNGKARYGRPSRFLTPRRRKSIGISSRNTSSDTWLSDPPPPLGLGLHKQAIGCLLVVGVPTVQNSCGCPAGSGPSTLLIVSTQRDELHQLIDELPEEQVADALAMLRARKSRGRRDWPPRWFGAVQAGRSDTAQRAEEILRDGFGRSA
jgi:hypothetical protein